MGIIVEIWQRGIVSDSGVRFVCESARPYYDDRKVVMKGIKQLGTLQGKKLSINLVVEDDSLVVRLPSSEKYNVLINGQEYVFSVIKK